MTGTAETEAGEFMSTYKLGVVPIPTNRPMQRKDQPDLVYKNEEAKFVQAVADIADVSEGSARTRGYHERGEERVPLAFARQSWRATRGAEREEPRA